MSTELRGAGLFDLRSLSTDTLDTLRQIHDSVRVGPEAEVRFFATVRRILLERGALSARIDVNDWS